MDSSAPKHDFAPATASAYLDPKYWDQRFAEEDHYEWFKDYSHFRHLILEYIKPNSAVLELGCGNSQLCEELYRDGITDLTCIDLSPVAVGKMKQRLLSKGYKEVKVLEADMLDLPFDDECFDVVIEKGTMDVLFVDSGVPWNPEAVTVSKVMAMLEGAHRVLKPHGTFISISFGQPHFRRPFFNAPTFTWSMEWRTFGDGFHYFFYVLKKLLELNTSNDAMHNGSQRKRPLCIITRGERSSNNVEHTENISKPSLTLLQEELDNEDYLFRTELDEM